MRTSGSIAARSDGWYICFTIEMLASDGPTIATHDRLPEARTLEAAADAYLDGFSGPPYFETGEDRAAFLDRVGRYAERDGFRLVLATEGERSIGVGLCVVGHPGDWWRDQVAAELASDEVRDWLGEAVLEIVDLAVIPDARGRGVGGAIHDALLDGARTPTAVLTADTRATPARALYEGRGWHVLRERFSVAGGDPVTLMVRRLG